MRSNPLRLLACLALVASSFACKGKHVDVPTYSVAGSVSGLLGHGLVLQVNGKGDLSVTADGPFQFATRLDAATSYAVTVLQQPTTPAQTCTVARGTGTIGANVVDVAVTCITNAYAIGGTVAGLQGSGLLLQDNGADDLLVGANGAFRFATPVQSGQAFTITVKTQPGSPAQTCAVSGGSGTVGQGDVASVSVNCDTNRYTLGGTVGGLAGGGLVLQNNGGDDLAVTANGGFAFASPVLSGATFAVLVKTQPTGPSQTCTVTAGAGAMVATDVVSVNVTCTTNRYPVGGTVTGLAGAGLVLQNNLGDNTAVSADGGFTFTTSVQSGDAYQITVLSQPTGPWQTCTVAGGEGLVTSDAVTGVSVTCATNRYAVGGTVTGLVGDLVVLQNNGGDDLVITSDRSFWFPTPVESGQPFTVTVKTQPASPTQTCTVSGGTGTMVGADAGSVVVNCAVDAYAVGGVVTGLEGSGLTLQLNGAAPFAVGASGSFAFPTTVLSGAGYLVAVATQPTTPWQTCVASREHGTVVSADVTDVTVTCTTNAYAVGGTVTGLRGTGLVLRNAGADDLGVLGDGAFVFPSSVASGRSYAVTVAAQPTAPSQTCTVDAGSGTLAGGDVTNVSVTCTTNTYSVGGTVTGLVGSGLVLANNGGDGRVVSANGDFVFATPVPSGGSYDVTVLVQPTAPSQTCTVAWGAGPVGSMNVTDVSVVCVTNLYLVGGTVAGLAGTGLTLRNNAGDDLPVSSSGAFSFATPVASGQPYAVTIAAQPSGPTQTCSVSGGSGTVGGGAVASVLVNCTTNAYAVGGLLSGLGTAAGLVLQNNGGDDLALTADGTFSFPTPALSGSTYDVTVKTNPTSPWETCLVTGGAGPVTSAAITTVQVSCTPRRFAVAVSVSGLAGTGLVLQDNGADNLSVGANGLYTFSQTVASGAAYSVTVLTNPSAPWQTCTVTAPAGAMPDGVTLAVACSTNTYTVGGTVSGAPVTGLVLRNNGGDPLSVSATGTFTFPTRVASGGSYAVTVASQPTAGICSVTSGAGSVTSANVTGVVVTCIDNPCASYGGIRVVINANIWVCQASAKWGTWSPALIPAPWTVCTVSQWAAHAPAGTPRSYGLESIWINNNSCGPGMHHEVYVTYPMNMASCYDGSDCCWNNETPLQFAVCRP
jgi:hypothetical protein